MKKITLFLLSICLILALAPAMMAEEAKKEEKKLFILSPTVGYFFPSSSKTRDAFGSSWGGFGVALNPEALGWHTPRMKAAGLTLSPYIGYSYAKEGENKAYIIPVGLATSWSLRKGKNHEYSLGLALAAHGVRVKVPGEGINSDWKIAPGGRITLGYSLAKWLELTAGYNLMTEVEDYNFNGFTIGAKVNFYF